MVGCFLRVSLPVSPGEVDYPDPLPLPTSLQVSPCAGYLLVLSTFALCFVGAEHTLRLESLLNKEVEFMYCSHLPFLRMRHEPSSRPLEFSRSDRRRVTVEWQLRLFPFCDCI